VHCVVNLSAEKFQETGKTARKNVSLKDYFKVPITGVISKGDCSMDSRHFETFLDYLLFLII
jgi:hypothetical protein